MIKEIPFNIPLITGKEIGSVLEVFHNKNFRGDGIFTKRCNAWLEEKLFIKKALLTTSCTHSLEIAAILADIKPQDEVVMPSFTFVSTANAFALRGAKIVFVDIRPDTLNIDEERLEEVITRKTKAIVPVHYAGVGCEMDAIMEMAEKYNLLIIEDAAHGVMANYKNRPLGGIGHIGCYSFHETKNYHCGEGGAILINDDRFLEMSEIVTQKGTNRKKFIDGKIDKYTWLNLGSSYLPSEILAAFLYSQLETASEIMQNRMKTWDRYFDNLKRLEAEGLLELQKIPAHCEHNAHMFYIKLENDEQRKEMAEYLKCFAIESASHYIPLHLSKGGKKYGEFRGEDRFTTKESKRILRLPMYHGLDFETVDYVCEHVEKFFQR